MLRRRSRSFHAEAVSGAIRPSDSPVNVRNLDRTHRSEEVEFLLLVATQHCKVDNLEVLIGRHFCLDQPQRLRVVRDNCYIDVIDPASVQSGSKEIDLRLRRCGVLKRSKLRQERVN